MVQLTCFSSRHQPPSSHPLHPYLPRRHIYHILYLSYANLMFQMFSEPSNNVIASVASFLSLCPQDLLSCKQISILHTHCPLSPSIHLRGVTKVIVLTNVWVSAEAVPPHYGGSGINEKRKCNKTAQIAYKRGILTMEVKLKYFITMFFLCLELTIT